MTAISSNPGQTVSAHIPDYPPPFKNALPVSDMLRRALWAIEGGMGGPVEWMATFGDRQTTVTLDCAVACFGRKLRRKH